MKYLILLSTILGAIIIILYIIRLLLFKKRISVIRRELRHYKEFGQLYENMESVKLEDGQKIEEKSIKRVIIEIATRLERKEPNEFIRELNLFVGKITVSDVINMNPKDKRIFKNLRELVKLLKKYGSS